MSEVQTVLSRTLALIGGKEATPEQVYLNVVRWRNEQARREIIKQEAISSGLSISEVKARYHASKLQRTKEIKVAKIHKAKFNSAFGEKLAELSFELPAVGK